MATSNIERYLESFGKYIVQQAKSNLSKSKKNTTKDLYDSIRFVVKKTNKGFSVNFYMLDYGAFVDKGVSGKKKIQEYKTWDNRTIASPFQFGTGSSPVGKAEGGMSGIMAKWVKRKGFQWKNKETGKFMSHKSMGYLIARSIYRDGIKSTSFFQRPLMLGMRKFNKELLSNVAQDIRNSFSTTTIN
tara:strand:+ start:387 stop:947 length:561 start_codon:yes stop_codon:yes gene_type:complete